MEELPRVAALHAHYVDAGLRTRYLTEYSVQEMQAFLESNPLPFEFYADAKGEFERFGMDFIWGSEFLLIDHERRVVADTLYEIEEQLPVLLDGR